jgi:hypothetical protein
MVDRLVAEFGDRFERTRIEDLMADSLKQLARAPHRSRISYRCWPTASHAND